MRPHTKSPSNVNKAFIINICTYKLTIVLSALYFFKNRKVLTQKPSLFKLKPKSR